MLIDTEAMTAAPPRSYDVCIVGGGAAGITLARKLRRHPALTVAVLESGGLDPAPDTQDLYRGTVTSTALPRRYLSTSRLRYFGGSTNHWNGMCRPLDRLDFTPRPWVPDSGWPLTREELAPYYRTAADVLQFEPYDDEWGEVSSGDRSLIAAGGDWLGRTFHMSPPTRFGRVYRDELASAENVDVLLHANVVHIDLDESGERVARIQIAGLSGRRGTVYARCFVLAAGGIENARLLLASTAVHQNGIGNANDCVGRYFMEHPELSVGLVMVTDHQVFGDLFRVRNTMLCPSEATQRQHQILNLNLQLAPDDPPGVPQSGTDVNFAAVLKAIDTPDAAADSGLPDYLSCYLRLESAPRRDNRVTLDPLDRDALNLPRPRLTFRMGLLETRTLNYAIDLLASEFGRRSAGRMRRLYPDEAAAAAFGEPPWRGLQHGSHHVGTTRMSDDPKTGVVDRNCRLHGVGNLFIAGSSVFPTSGMANPTYTIVALALRLADHLATTIAGGRS